VASVGVPLPGVEVEVRGPEGRALPERRLGRVWVRSASLMREYLGQPQATAAALSGGWLDTGDLAFVEGGELFLSGRAKDVVVVRGANHAPEEFEAALEGVAGLRPGCAVALGIAGDDGAEELWLLAERAGGEAALGDAALGAVAARAVTERTGVAPGQVRVLEPGTLPRTSSGKLRRGEARRRLLRGSLSPPGPVTALGLLGRMTRSALALARVRRQGARRG
jgi:acyl-CoA synthetase (AMP-forming)/AMP-acid ligase II